MGSLKHCWSCGHPFPAGDEVITICPDCIGKESLNTATVALFRKWCERMTALRFMPYSEYLKTPEWTIARRKALHNAKNKCQLCSRKEHLEVHHNSYERLGCEADADMIVLCDRCHGRHHSKED